jgi:hypothetical protein
MVGLMTEWQGIPSEAEAHVASEDPYAGVEVRAATLETLLRRAVAHGVRIADTHRVVWHTVDGYQEIRPNPGDAIERGEIDV